MAGATRRDGERKSAGHVKHAEILGGIVLIRQHIDNEREVDGHVYAEAESADGHADQETVEVAGDGDHEHRRAVHGRRREHEDFPPARPVGKLAADEGSGDNDDGLDQRAQEYLLRYLGLGAADLFQQVVSLISSQESVG
jgi:hypothetical protein